MFSKASSVRHDARTSPLTEQNLLTQIKSRALAFSSFKSTECRGDAFVKNDYSESMPLVLAKVHQKKSPSILRLSKPGKLGFHNKHFCWHFTRNLNGESERQNNTQAARVWLAKWCKIHKVYIHSHSIFLLRESPPEDHAGKSTVHISDSPETCHTCTTSLAQ